MHTESGDSTLYEDLEFLDSSHKPSARDNRGQPTSSLNSAPHELSIIMSDIK